MRRLAFMVDPERLFDYATLRIAHVAAALDSEADLEAWLEQRIVEASRVLMQRDARLVGASEDLDSGDLRLDHYAFLLALPLRRILPALVAFNELPYPERHAFFALLIEDIPVEECLSNGLGPPEVLRERCLRALRTILLEPLAEEGLL